MSNKTGDISGQSIGDLFDSKKEFQIPLYQRNFSWGKPEVTQLIRDIADYAVKSREQKYYLGILVVYPNSQDKLEVVDGQQRLTVLFLLLWALQHEDFELDMEPGHLDLGLDFAHRPKAQTTLEAIEKNQVDDLEDEQTHTEITNVYNEIPLLLSRELKDTGCSVDQFYTYLSEQVILYQSELPSDTDLNHYFEVMNNRGEQLEKQEIIKADLLSIVDSSDDDQKDHYKHVVNKIWEACSNMNRYVQYGFSTDSREGLFGEEWNTWQSWSLEEAFEKLCDIIEEDSETSPDDGQSIQGILDGTEPEQENLEEEDKSPDRFQSVINFPNFLLHVLRIYQHIHENENNEMDADDYASLDDKVLLDEFKENDLEFVKTFSVLLLKTRFLFDQYVIKRKYEGETDEWSLLKLKYYPKEGDRKQESTGYVNTFGDEESNQDSQNKQPLMLLAMFHVSTPTQNYKHWLTAVLYYLVTHPKLNAERYTQYLEDLARKFFFDRFMVKDSGSQQKYEEMVFLSPKQIKGLKNWEVNKELLRYQNVRNNLVFNYLDYLIWKGENSEDSRIKQFDFKFRSSVEHFNPQNPKGHDKLEEEKLHSFGNLCLVAHGKNSSFGNNSPLSKAFNESEETPLDSLKLYKMMKKAKADNQNNDEQETANGGWGPDQVESHEEEMIKYYRKQLR